MNSLTLTLTILVVGIDINNDFLFLRQNPTIISIIK